MAAANGNGGTRAQGPRCIALVGPFQAGKTTLLEAILARTGAIQRQGTVEAGTTVGDASKEARHHKMSVELTVATTTFMGDSYTFIDCPGSVEFVHDMRAALPAVDAAVVVCEADEKKMPQLQLILRELEDLNIPRFLFLNKIDKAETKVMEALQILQPASRKPLVMRQLPIRQNDIVTGFVDLALERVHIYKEHAPSEVVPLDGENLDNSKDARFSMLEKLADHDDELMEQLLADIPPPRDKVFDDLAKELRDGLVVPVLMGVATRTNGVLRLLKALRHEAPNVEAHRQAAGRQGRRAAGLCAEDAQHRPRRQDVDRPRADRPDRRRRHAACRPSARPAASSGTFKLVGQTTEKRGPAAAGETVALGKLEYAKTGDTLSAGKQAHAAVAEVEPHPAVLAISVSAKERKDDVKLGQALHKLVDEDPSIHLVHNPETHEVVMWGQGEMHLRVAAEKLAGHFGVAISTGRPSVGYNETIKKAVQPARPAQEAVRRPRPVRRRGARHQAAAAQRRLQVRGQDHRRRGAAQLHPLGRGGRHQRAQARPARLPGGGPVGGAGRRLLSHRRFLRHGVPDRGAHRHRRRPAAVPAGAARADPPGRDRLPDRRHRQDERASCPAGAAKFSASTPARAGTAGTWCAPRCRNPRSATSSSRCARRPPASARSPSSSTTWPN